MTPAQLSAFGLIVLCLNPFSYVPNDARVVLAIALMIVLGSSIERTVADPHRLTTEKQAIRDVAVRNSDSVYAVFRFLFAYSVLLAIMSIVTLFATGSWELSELVGTTLRALASMLSSFLEVMAGYYLASHGSSAVVRRAIYGSVFGMALLCGYQFLSERFNLPFIGRYVDDRFVGLRLSGLAVEPKYLSGYMAAVAFFFWDDRPTSPITNALRLIGLAACLSIFQATSSGNGFLGVILMLAIRLMTARASNFVATVAVISIAVYIFATKLSLDDFELRGSHTDLLNSLSSFDFMDLDDLIVLPLLAWSNNVWNVFFGFGPGLLHFYAAPFIWNATWVTSEVYIKGNLSAIGLISQFGVILFTVIGGSVLVSSLRMMRLSTVPSARALDIFFLNSFVFGALIAGNISIPFYISIGWLVSRSNSNGAGSMTPPAHRLSSAKSIPPTASLSGNDLLASTIEDAVGAS
jgi:hypothetical protein